MKTGTHQVMRGLKLRRKMVGKFHSNVDQAKQIKKIKKKFGAQTVRREFKRGGGG